MSRAKVVTDGAGTRGRITRVRSRDVVVQLDDGKTVNVPRRLLQQRGDEYALATTFDRIKPDEMQVTVPVMEESLEVRTRKSRSGVRVSKTVKEREAVVDLPELQQQVKVQRVPVNRVVDGPVAAREVDGTMIIPVMEEQAVVTKRWVLREEIRITRTEVKRRTQKRVVLKSETAHIEPHKEHRTRRE